MIRPTGQRNVEESLYNIYIETEISSRGGSSSPAVVHLEPLARAVGALDPAAAAAAPLHERGVEVALHTAESAAAVAHWHHAHSYKNKQSASQHPEP